MKSALVVILGLTITNISSAYGNTCAAFFHNGQNPVRVLRPGVDDVIPARKAPRNRPPRVKKTRVIPEVWTQDTAWVQSQETISQIQNMIPGKDSVIQGLMTAMLAKEFVWLNGDPGGAKTLVSRVMYTAQLNALKITEQEKKIFVLQFHKLMAEGIITGFPKLKVLLEKGRYELETESSLVGDKYLFLIADEAEKANPATLTSLLSVLNERKAFLGSKIVDTALSSGVFTSNKTTAEFLQGGRENRPGLEALLDRMAIKQHVPNMEATPGEFLKVYEAVTTGSMSGLKTLNLPLHKLQDLVSKVEIPASTMDELANLIQKMDELTTGSADASLANIRSNVRGAQEYFPANQFSNRSILKLLNVMKASFIADQIMSGRKFEDLELKMDKKDLYHVSRAAVYGGPAQIRLKHFKLGEIDLREYEYNVEFKVEAEWNPYSRYITFTHKGFPKEKTVRVYIDETSKVIHDEHNMTTINEKDLEALRKKIKEQEETNQFDKNEIVYEVDNGITALLSNRAIPTRTRNELTQILNDTNALVSQLNAVQKADKDAVNKRLEEAKRKIRNMKAWQNRWSSYLKVVATSPSMPEYKKEKAYYDAVQFAIKSLKISFPELDHSVMAHMVALLGGQHVYVFGPPGGAKTALARQIINSALEWEQIKNPGYTEKQMERFANKFAADLKSRSHEQYEMFFLQFHPMIPEGNIIGFPKLQSQIDTGKIEMDFSTSLAHKKFIFTILDEVEKGNPAVLASLLSALNEREVFSGQDVIKMGLRSAVLTSNKMPSELLDSFLEDRPTGSALMDRSINKAYVPNKFTNVGALSQFMLQYEAGLKSELAMPLPLLELRQLVERVEIDEHAMLAMAEIANDFVGKRLEVEERTMMLNREDNVAYPDYYVKASQGSTRSAIQYFNQFKTYFILKQIEDGVKFEDLRYKAELSDISLLISGIGYWGPYKFKTTYDKNGILSFVLDKSALDSFGTLPYINARNKYMIEKISEEASDFQMITNDKVGEFTIKYREMIAKFPNLFPTLFATDAQREAFLDKTLTKEEKEKVQKHLNGKQ